MYTCNVLPTDRLTDLFTDLLTRASPLRLAWNMNKELLPGIGAFVKLSCVATQEGDDYGPSPKVTDEVDLVPDPPPHPQGQKTESP